MPVDEQLLGLLCQQRDLLDRQFGPGEYELVNSERGPVLSTATVEISFGYDYRDGWIGALVKPLRVHPSRSHPTPLHFWLRFLGEEEQPTSFHEPLSERHVRDVLDRLEAIEPLLRNPERLREAAEFVNGYGTAVGDWLRKRGHWARSA